MKENRDKNARKEVYKFCKNIFTTIQALYAENPIELLKYISLKESDLKRREYIGLSGIGGHCLRKMYYDLRHYPKSDLPEYQNVLGLVTGHYLHMIIQGVAKEVYGVDVEVEKEVEISGAKGHIDLIFNIAGMKIIIDIKTCNSNMFLLYLGGYKKEQYEIQLGMYKEAVNADFTFYLFVERDTFDFYVKESKLPKDKIAKVLSKIMTLQKHLGEGVLPDRPYFTRKEGNSGDCKYCNFVSSCWKDYNKSRRDSELNVIYATKDEAKRYKEVKEEVESLKVERDDVQMSLKEIKDNIARLNSERNSLIETTEASMIVIGNKSLKRITTSRKIDIDKEKAFEYLKEIGEVANFLKNSDSESIREVNTPKEFKEENNKK
jgi:hypothetical protein